MTLARLVGRDLVVFSDPASTRRPTFPAASAVSMSLLRMLYVSAPTVSSLPEFLGGVQPDAAGRKDVGALAKAQGWEAERDAYQAGRKARTRGQGAALAS